MGAVGEVPGAVCGEHVLQLHRTEDERLAELTAWVCRGLDLGEKVVCTEVPHRREDALAAVLEARGVDAAAAARDGRLAIMPVADFYAPDCHTEVVERALADGFPAVRMWGAEHLALTALSASDYQVVEERMDEFVAVQPVHTLCQYPDATTVRRLADVVAVHRSGVRQATFSTTRDLDGLALHGEVDAANAHVFEAVLVAACRSASRVLWLDMADVEHLDAGACWRLDDATRSTRMAGSQVLLVAPPPPVELILRLMEVDELPGVHVLAGHT